MTACLAWLAADYLHRLKLPHDDPPCSHDQADCPPLPAHRARHTPTDEETK